MADDFDDYLDALNKAELEAGRKAQERSKQEAITHYNDWASHFELVKRNFEETHALFGTIEEKVASWKRSESNLIGNYGEGYCFGASVYKYDKRTNAHGKMIEIGVGSLGDERILRVGDYRETKMPDELYGLEKLTPALLTPKNTEQLIARINKAVIRFALFGDTNKKAAGKTVKLGFLYDHNLADTCKEIFRMMNSEDKATWKERLSEIIPEGDYSIRSGYMAGRMDDNIIVHAEDPKWRNG